MEFVWNLCHQREEIFMLKRQSGFTLIEMMVVIALIVVLSAIAIPNYIAWVPKYRLNTAVDNLIVTLQQARLRAIRDNANVVINFDGGANTSMFVDSGVTGDPNDPFDPACRGNGARDCAEPSVGGMEMPAGIQVVGVAFGGGTTLVYNSRGIANAGGNVRLKNNREQYKGVSVSLTGSIRIERSEDGVTWN
jgi:prepilin-type N-terminal cleavage/methylation domain-containing protein